MATVVRELLASRATPTVNGKFTGFREFAVYDDGAGTPFTTPDQVKALYGTATSPDAMPTRGSQFPSLTTLVALNDHPARMDGNSNVWNVRWEYEKVDFPISGLQPHEIGYSEFGFNIETKFVEAWRGGPFAFPTGGNPSGRGDIGGNPLDSGGEPGSTARLKQVFEFTETMSIDTLITNASTYVAAVGKRNSDTFYGALPGRLVMLPVVSSRIALNKVHVRFGFSWDEWYHMEQMAERDDEGKVFQHTPDPEHKNVAESVYWIQPFPSSYNFTGISANW